MQSTCVKLYCLMPLALDASWVVSRSRWLKPEKFAPALSLSNAHLPFCVGLQESCSSLLIILIILNFLGFFRKHPTQHTYTFTGKWIMQPHKLVIKCKENKRPQSWPSFSCEVAMSMWLWIKVSAPFFQRHKGGGILACRIKVCCDSRLS